MKKFELTTESINLEGRTLHRIKALLDFGDVGTGDLGGWVEKEENLSHDGLAWVCGDAWVYDNAKVCGDAWVYDNAQVYGDAKVYGNAQVYGDAKVYGNAQVCGGADYATAKGFGSVFRNTSFFRLKNGGVGVRCGCFYGTLAEFREKVRDTYPGDKRGKEYLMLADLMEYHFGNS